jgi:hypothetical protein
MVVDCANCGVTKQKQYTHSLGKKHYCFTCQPSLFNHALSGMSVWDQDVRFFAYDFVDTGGIWNHAS